MDGGRDISPEDVPCMLLNPDEACKGAMHFTRLAIPENKKKAVLVRQPPKLEYR